MRMLFSLLLFSSTVTAQSFFFPGDSAFISTIGLPSKQPFDTARHYLKAPGPYVYIISDKDLYHHFGYAVAAEFYQFNFVEHHIVGSQQCRQCLLFCNHDKGEINCHRNACSKQWIWAKRDNKKAFTNVSSYAIPWYEGKDNKTWNDTILVSSQDSCRWYTTGRGDCFASFEYGLVADRYYPVLILKEWNYWGGCRAGGSKPATIVFKEPEGILHKIKRTILMEKHGN